MLRDSEDQWIVRVKDLNFGQSALNQSRDGVPCTLLVVYLVDDDVTISQNNGINSSGGIGTRNALGARRIHWDKRLASTRLSVNRKKNRIIARSMLSPSDIIFACEKEYDSYRATIQKLA